MRMRRRVAVGTFVRAIEVIGRSFREERMVGGRRGTSYLLIFLGFR